MLALGRAGDAPASTGDDADAARTLALVSDISFGLGVVAVAAGVVLLVLDDSGDSGSERARLSITPVAGPRSAGAVAALEF